MTIYIMALCTCRIHTTLSNKTANALMITALTVLLESIVYVLHMYNHLHCYN